MTPVRVELLRAYLVVYPEFCAERAPEFVAREAVAGGVTLVQLRVKDRPTREFVELARRVRDALDGTGVPLIINDRVDVALAVGAAGVHVGQTDMAPADARRMMGPDAIVGLSADTPGQAAAAATEPVDYLGVGPVWATGTKANTSPAWGTEGLARLRPRCALPFVGIGGVSVERAGEAVRAGADGVAVVSAVCSAPDVHAAAAALRSAVEDALATR